MVSCANVPEVDEYAVQSSHPRKNLRLCESTTEAVTIKVPPYPRVEQVFDDLLADVFEQYAGISRKYLLVVRKECLAEDKLRVFIAFLRDPAKDTNFTSSDLQPIHASIFTSNKFLMAQGTLKILSVYKVTAMHPSVELDEVFPTSPASPAVKKSVTFRDVRGSVSISGAMSTFIVIIIVVKRFIALEDYDAYAGRTRPQKMGNLETHESLEMLRLP